MVFNKIDLYRSQNYDDLIDQEAKEEIEEGLKGSLNFQFGQDNVLVSALSKENIDILRAKITAMVKEQYKVRYPYQVKHW